ncbi:hypothetical protein [Asanoa hainanensis]|nr:hypothetical protein [Asanoa hainanensis]
MTDPNHHQAAPVPVGDVVPGDPPVPITVWPLPAPEPDETMSPPMGVRLVHNLTHRSDLIIDLTTGPQLARAIISAHRRGQSCSASAADWGQDRAALIVTAWPLADSARSAEAFFGQCLASLVRGGCVAVLLAHGDPIRPVDVVIAAKAAGLSYLQHIVAAHRAPTPGNRTQLNIHTDVLVLTRPHGGGDQNG